jgi:hypothetical protein
LRDTLEEISRGHSSGGASKMPVILILSDW